MHTSASSKRRVLRLVAVYTLMTVTVVAFVTVLVFLMLGYRFNRATGVIQQGGLVQFDTTPNGATVHVNAIELANQTPSKITLNPGSYTITMERPDYMPWQKNVTVTAGTVLRLGYARLIPTKLTTTPVVSLDKLAGMSSRPGQAKIALLPSSTQPELMEIDTGSDPVKTSTITLPASLYHTGEKQSFKLGDYSRDDKHLLVSHTYDGKTEWLYVDMHQPKNSLNLTSLFALKPAKILFDTRSDDSLFVLSHDGTVHSLNLSHQTMSRILIRDVRDISLQGTRALWFSAQPSKGVMTTGYLTLGTATPRTVAQYKTTEPVFVGAGDYFGKTYLSTVADSKLTVATIDQFPSSDSNTSIQTTLLAAENLSSPATGLTIYSGGRFAAVLHRQSQDVYDIELGTLASVPLRHVSSTTQSPPRWLDGYYFYDDASGELRLYEYDGTNQHAIASVASGFQAILSHDGKYLYSIGKTKTGYQLQQTRLILQ